MSKKPRIIKVVHKVIDTKFGDMEVWGWADAAKASVELDTRLRGKKHLEILVHEVAHCLWPDATEEEIEWKSIALCNTLWKQGYRRADLANHQHLQDGKR